MTDRTATTATAVPHDAQEFSLVCGGLLFRLWMRGRLCDSSLGLIGRRMVVAAAVTWIPLLVLTAQGGALGGGSSPLFLSDIGIHLRFLIVTPLLIGAELVVHRRLRPLAEQFRARGLVRSAQDHRLDSIFGSALKLRNSTVAEILLLVVVYGVGVPVMSHRFALRTGVWYSQAAGSASELSLAGWWLVLVSLPIFQFLLCRWYFRLFIWTRYLRRISQLDLELDAAHPDGAGGLGFLSGSINAFIPLAFAHGVLLAGVIADRILYAGATLPAFTVQLISTNLFLLILFVGPLAVFTPLLARVKRQGLLAYGALGQSYVRAFEMKWQGARAPTDETLLGSGDIQSLADFAGSYAIVAQMRLVPISGMAMLQFVLALIIPLLPLVLTVMSAKELLGLLVGLLV